MGMVRSKQRVADHGEVFTPAWMVEAMLDLVQEETEQIDSRFLEPACGSGNFLVEVLRRKLAVVDRKFGRSDFERRHYALLGLMCIYGIELLDDNIVECRANLLEVFAVHLGLDEADDLHRAAAYVLSQNLVHGDALTMRTTRDEPIVFAEWGYVGKGKFRPSVIDDRAPIAAAATSEAGGPPAAASAAPSTSPPTARCGPATVAHLIGSTRTGCSSITPPGRCSATCATSTPDPHRVGAPEISSG